MILAPSVLSLDYTQFKEQVTILNEKVEWLHFDVMDGHFVPNISFGPDILKAFRRSSPLFMDVHLMISDPKTYIKSFANAGADGITFHIESLNNDIKKAKELIDYIHSFYLKAAVSIKPQSEVEVIKPLLEYADMVLVMSVEPGFGGQKFMRESLPKIMELNKYRVENNLNYLIEVDGGVSETNSKELVEAGCDILVAGSSVFKGDIESNINRIVYSAAKE